MQYSVENIDKHLDFFIDCVVRLGQHLKNGTLDQIMDPNLKEFKNIIENNQDYFFEAEKRIIKTQLKYYKILS